jgi:glycosyltransferase involved in cell wall biosynthesis
MLSWNKMVEQPLVTIVLPIRNEAAYIARCLDAVIAQDYPHEKIEVFVVDGQSNDGTRELVAQYSTRDPRIRLMDNPNRIVPTALNRAIRAAHGEVIIRVDGHAIIALDYVRRCVEILNEVGADCVGGPIETVGETVMSRAIAMAQSSPFGVGSAAFRYARDARYVDTLAFGAQRREVFDRVGMFDEALVRNQDDEFNFRLTRAGGKIWLDPRIHSSYFSRSTLRALCSQYFGYGLWKIRVIQKHHRVASRRHLLPAALVLTLVGAAMASVIVQNVLPFLLVASAYAFGSLGTSLILSVRNGWKFFPLIPLAFAVMHFGYGLGFLYGLICWNLPSWSGPARRQSHETSL